MSLKQLHHFITGGAKLNQTVSYRFVVFLGHVSEPLCRPCREPGQHVREDGKPHALALLRVQIRRGSFFRLPPLRDEDLGRQGVRGRTGELHRGHRHPDPRHRGQHGQQAVERGTGAGEGGLRESPLRAAHGSDALLLQQWAEGHGSRA